MAFSIYSLYRIFQPAFRSRRTRLFLDQLQPDETMRILDVGGYVYDWQGVVPIESHVTLLNLSHPPTPSTLPARFELIVGDGLRLKYPDHCFDIAYSNSVIEHVGSFEDQQQFAAELRRVGRQLFVQTPNRWFFIEPHFITVFIHFLPATIARPLLRRCSVRGLFRGGDNLDLKQLAAELRLLSYREMRTLFPDCVIHREKWFGMTKSFIAIRR